MTPIPTTDSLPELIHGTNFSDDVIFYLRETTSYRALIGFRLLLHSTWVWASENNFYSTQNVDFWLPVPKVVLPK